MVITNDNDFCCTLKHVTSREAETIELVAAGLTNEQIGRRLRISACTAANHIQDAMRRLGARSRAELVARSYSSGPLHVDVWPPVLTGRRCVPTVSRLAAASLRTRTR